MKPMPSSLKSLTCRENVHHPDVPHKIYFHEDIMEIMEQKGYKKEHLEEYYKFFLKQFFKHLSKEEVFAINLNKFGMLGYSLSSCRKYSVNFRGIKDALETLGRPVNEDLVERINFFDKKGNRALKLIFDENVAPKIKDFLKRKHKPTHNIINDGSK